MKKPTITALVPMRHHSQRVPQKNFRPLAGKPLFHYILHTLQACQQIDTIVVDTDSPEISQGIQTDFPGVVVLDRPIHLRADEVSMNEVLIYDTTQVKADFYLQTHSTNPLLRAETVERAITQFLEAYPGYDSLFAVTRLQTRLWDQVGRAINHNPTVLIQTQDLPPVFMENSCLYIFTAQTLLEKRNRLGDRPQMFEIESDEAWDIDNELDFAITDFLMRRKMG